MRRVTDERLREIVRARITRGAAFTHDRVDYLKLQELVRGQLAALTRAEIFDRFPARTYDLKR